MRRVAFGLADIPRPTTAHAGRTFDATQGPLTLAVGLSFAAPATIGEVRAVGSNTLPGLHKKPQPLPPCV